MQINEQRFEGVTPIDGYGPNRFRVGGQAYEGATAVLPGGVRPWGGYDDTETILAARDAIDVILIGTGPEIAHIPRDFRAALEDAGLGVEIMASAQACRTYNVLLGEGRRVGAALLPVG